MTEEALTAPTEAGQANQAVPPTNIELNSGDDMFTRAEKLFYIGAIPHQIPAIFVKGLALYYEVDQKAFIEDMLKQSLASSVPPSAPPAGCGVDPDAVKE